MSCQDHSVDPHLDLATGVKMWFENYLNPMISQIGEPNKTHINFMNDIFIFFIILKVLASVCDLHLTTIKFSQSFKGI